MDTLSRWLTAEREQWRGCAETFRKYAFAVFKAAFLGMFLCHALFLFYGYTSPDGTNEGYSITGIRIGRSPSVGG